MRDTHSIFPLLLLVGLGIYFLLTPQGGKRNASSVPRVAEEVHAIDVRLGVPPSDVRYADLKLLPDTSGVVMQLDGKAVDSPDHLLQLLRDKCRELPGLVVVLHIAPGLETVVMNEALSACQGAGIRQVYLPADGDTP